MDKLPHGDVKFKELMRMSWRSLIVGAARRIPRIFCRDSWPMPSATLHSASDFSAHGATDWPAAKACIRPSSTPSSSSPRTTATNYPRLKAFSAMNPKPGPSRSSRRESNSCAAPPPRRIGRSIGQPIRSHASHETARFCLAHSRHRRLPFSSSASSSSWVSLSVSGIVREVC